MTVSLFGDRSAWDTVDYPDEHARDINDGALEYHLPLPSSVNELVQSDGTNWSSVTAPTFEGAVTIDVTSTEALLVRKNADGGDVFTFDTTNSRLLIADGGAIGQAAGPLLTFDDTNDDLLISGFRFIGLLTVTPADNFDIHGIIRVTQIGTAANYTRIHNTGGEFIFDATQSAGGSTPTLKWIAGSQMTFTQNLFGGVICGGFAYLDIHRNFAIQAASGKGIAFFTNGAFTTPDLFIVSGGDAIFGGTTPAAQLHIDQASASGAQPVLYLDQGDVSEQLILGSYSGADVDMIIIELDVTGAPKIGWDESADMFTFNKGLSIGGAPPTNATLLSIEDGITFKEIAAPTADAGYGKIWTTTDNELFFQSGAGVTHLLHGDAFSNIWFHGSTTGAMTVEVTIATQNALTKINSFTVVGHEDDLANVVGSSANDNLTLSAIGGGEYEISYHGSVTATGGADKEMLIALGITLATAKDITVVTDDTVTPIVITSTAHGLEDGDMVQIVGVLGNTAANGSFIVDGKTNDTFKIVKLDGSATTGNGDYNEGSPTGDITILYPGNMVVHREVRGATLSAISATGLHILANSDVLSVYVANLDGITNLTVSAVSFDAVRIGD